MEPEVLALVLFACVAAGIFLGFPVFAVLAGVGLIGGFIGWGPQVFHQMMLRAWSITTNDALPAVPLFVFMGSILSRAGVAERAFGSMRAALGPLRGSVLLGTILICTLLAAGTGIVGASVTIAGLLSLPTMLKYKYDIPLATGGILAGGTLGILIPPSIMLILYGPLAGLPIPKLFTAAMLPGLVLSGLYLLYIGIVCAVRPELGPSVPPEERAIPRLKLLTMVMVNIFPFLLIVVAVLGSIIFGIAAPTEAAGVGALCCLCLAAAYREISWGRLKDAVYETMMISTFILTITVAANIFGGVFLALGGGKIIESFLLGLPVGPYGILAVVLVMVFIMGFFLDWIPILLIFTPILAPIIPKLGFDPLWFGILFAVCLQTSFLTPPFAVSIFYLKGIAPPEVELSHIYKGVVPFIILQLIGLALCIVFPQIVLWLPSVVYG